MKLIFEMETAASGTLCIMEHADYFDCVAASAPHISLYQTTCIVDAIIFLAVHATSRSTIPHRWCRMVKELTPIIEEARQRSAAEPVAPGTSIH